MSPRAMTEDVGTLIARLTDESWDRLLNTDDRNSPADYPDHCLITRSELESFLREAVTEALEARRQAP